MKKVAFPAIFSKASSLADKSIKLEFTTREMGKDAATLFGMLQSEGWLLFSPEELTEASIPTEKPDPLLDSKTPSQRLRNALWVLWEQKGKPQTFEIFYAAKLEQIIDQVKEKLE